MKEQFTLLGTISNFRHYPYPSQRKNNLIINPKHVTYSEHLLHDESETISQEEKVRKYIPTSPRNQIMYSMCCNQEKSSELHHLIKHLLLCDMHDKDKGTIVFHEDMSQPPPAKKKRKHSSHIVSVTRRAILAEVGENGENIDEDINCANQDRTLYKTFKEQLVTIGVIKWRLH